MIYANVMKQSYADIMNGRNRVGQVADYIDNINDWLLQHYNMRLTCDVTRVKPSNDKIFSNLYEVYLEAYTEKRCMYKAIFMIKGRPYLDVQTGQLEMNKLLKKAEKYINNSFDHWQAIENTTGKPYTVQEIDTYDKSMLQLPIDQRYPSRLFIDLLCELRLYFTEHIEKIDRNDYIA